MALRILLNRGTAVRHHQKPGLLGLLKFSDSINRKTNDQIFQKRDFSSTGSESGYAVRATLFSVTITNAPKQRHMIKLARFAVKEHNARQGKANLRFVRVLDAKLGFRCGVPRFDIKLEAIDDDGGSGGGSGGGGLTRCYKARFSSSNGVDNLDDFLTRCYKARFSKFLDDFVVCAPLASGILENSKLAEISEFLFKGKCTFVILPHEPPRLNFWEDPLSPSKWKIDHILFWQLIRLLCLQLLIYVGYKFITRAMKEQTEEEAGDSLGLQSLE